MRYESLLSVNKLSLVKALELRIHPPYLWVIFGLPALLGDWGNLMHPLSLLLSAVAGVLGSVALLSFFIARTTYKPHQPHRTCRLVTSGVYRYSRNPMYLGLVLLLIALYVAMRAWWGVALVPLFVLWLQRFQISVEERILRENFGQEYLAYLERVRRWC